MGLNVLVILARRLVETPHTTSSERTSFHVDVARKHREKTSSRLQYLLPWSQGLDIYYTRLENGLSRNVL